MDAGALASGERVIAIPRNRLSEAGCAEGVCDSCGGTAVTRRADDTAETVASRLDAYHAQAAPLIAYHARADVLCRIDAMGSIEEIAGRLSAIVKTATPR